MFNSISWAQYLSAIIIILFIYYILIGVMFYKWEILRIIGIRKVSEEPINATAALLNLKEFDTSENNEIYLPKTRGFDITPLVNSFTDEVSAYVRETDDHEITREQIISSLREICSKYPTIKNADCKNDLELMIQNKINLKYPSIFQQKDFEILWN